MKKECEMGDEVTCFLLFDKLDKSKQHRSFVSTKICGPSLDFYEDTDYWNLRKLDKGVSVADRSCLADSWGDNLNWTARLAIGTCPM